MSVIKQLRIWFDLMWYLKNVFGKMRVTADQVFFEFRVSSNRGHPFKLHKHYNVLFFSDRVISVRSNVPVSIAD